MALKKKNKSEKTEKQKVDERREEVLAKGRKFKYPLQWTRHKVVISAIVVSVVALIVIVVGAWAALYRANMTESLLFNITKVLPMPVAEVDGAPVRFSDYLMLYRSSIIPAEKQGGTQSGGDVTDLQDRYKRKALTEAEKYAYAMSLADELGISVSSEEVAEEFERHLKIGGIDRSEEGFMKIIEDNFGLTKSEYERMLYLTLLREKVEIAIDEQANEMAEKIEQMLAENGGDYQKVAEGLGEAIEYEDTGGLVDSNNIDGGRATMAMRLEPGEESGKFVSMKGDGYYFVKLVDKTDTKVNFVSIKVPFTEFEERFAELSEGGKISEYIEIDEEQEM